MSSMHEAKSRQAGDLAATLSLATGVKVDISWNALRASKRLGDWAWYVEWADGPTASAMQVLVERELARQKRLALQPNDLAYLRTVQPGSLALAMVRNVRQGMPPLGRHPSLWQLEVALEEVNDPELGTAQDVSVANVLVRLANDLPDRMPALLVQYGLAGLRAEIDPPANLRRLWPNRSRPEK